jgi:hypothetical protein
MQEYHKIIFTLFELLTIANRADSAMEREDWQFPIDANQRGGFFGLIRKSIVAIAGQDIVDFWTDTYEVDLSLASRVPGETEDEMVTRYLKKFGL